METYTIKFKENDQDNINFIPFKKGDKIPEFLDYEEVLERSIREHRIDSEADIITLADGSDHIQPYFSSNTAADECRFIVEDDANEEFNENQTEYDLSEIEHPY